MFRPITVSQVYNNLNLQTSLSVAITNNQLATNFLTHFTPLPVSILNITLNIDYSSKIVKQSLTQIKHVPSASYSYSSDTHSPTPLVSVADTNSSYTSQINQKSTSTSKNINSYFKTTHFLTPTCNISTKNSHYDTDLNLHNN